jgi:circadian clock protein KaiB
MVSNRPPDESDQSWEDSVKSMEDSDVMLSSFEQAIADNNQQHYCLRLYIAGATPRSIQALDRLKSLCETHLQGRYELEVIDIYKAPSELALENVVVIPTLVKKLPLPLRRIVGDLSDTEKVLKGLDIIPKD